MTQTTTIDYVVPMNFTVPLNGKVGITVNDYTQLGRVDTNPKVHLFGRILRILRR